MATLELPYEKVYDLLHKCCTSISPDVLYLMKRAAAKETNPEAKTFLETMLKNFAISNNMARFTMRAEKIIRKTVVLNLLRRQNGRFLFLSLPFLFYVFDLK